MGGILVVSELIEWGSYDGRVIIYILDGMYIQYYGLGCVKMTVKPGGRGAEDVVIVVNPFTKKGDLRPPQLSNADIVMVSVQGEEYCSDAVVKSDAVVLDMPGEYAVRGVQAVGVAVPDTSGAQKVTMFVCQSEGLKVVIMAGLGGKLSSAQFDELTDVDVLVVPVGGDSVLGAETAAEIVRKVEPSFVVPVQFHVKGAAETTKYTSLDDFCAVLGNKPTEQLQKFNVKKADCEGVVNQIVGLEI